LVVIYHALQVFYTRGRKFATRSKTDADTTRKVFTTLNLAIFTTLSLTYIHNNLYSALGRQYLVHVESEASTSSQYLPLLLSLFLFHQPSPWKSQIHHLDMHHRVFGINFQIHFVSFTILVSIHLMIYLSTHLCHHPHSHHPSLLHSFMAGSKPTFSRNSSYLRFLLPTGLPWT